MKELIGIGVFSLKLIIALVMIVSVLKIFLPDINNIRKEWKEFSSKRENQALMYSFIQNPVALTISGERDIERKNYDEASLKFELAVGLLEMHGASPTAIQPYQDRFLAAKKLAEHSAIN